MTSTPSSPYGATSERATFVGGGSGVWRVERIVPVSGATLPPAPYVDVVAGVGVGGGGTSKAWELRGVTSNARYTTHAEKASLVAVQEGLGRAAATCGVLIPIKKSQAWWDLAQDERRAIFEERSQHIAEGLRTLPAVARRLYHCRDLATNEPFDFLTWFEFAPDAVAAFDALLDVMRASEEWRYVEREVDVRLRRS